VGVAGILPPYRRKEKGRGGQIRNQFLEAGFSVSQNHVSWVIHKSCMNLESTFWLDWQNLFPEGMFVFALKRAGLVQGKLFRL